MPSLPRHRLGRCKTSLNDHTNGGPTLGEGILGISWSTAQPTTTSQWRANPDTLVTWKIFSSGWKVACRGDCNSISLVQCYLLSCFKKRMGAYDLCFTKQSCFVIVFICRYFIVCPLHTIMQFLLQVRSGHMSTAPRIPEYLRHMKCQVPLGSCSQSTATVPLYRDRDKFHDHHIAVDLGHGYKEYLYSAEWENIERYWIMGYLIVPRPVNQHHP